MLVLFTVHFTYNTFHYCWLCILTRILHTCYVRLLLMTMPLLSTKKKEIRKINTYHIFFLLYPCRVNYSPFKDLVTFAQENSTNQKLQSPLDMVTVSKKREVYKSKIRTDHVYSTEFRKNYQPNKESMVRLFSFNDKTVFARFVCFRGQSWMCIGTFGVNVTKIMMSGCHRSPTQP